MAFLEGHELERKERFSLLLLEPGEIYFEDFSVFYYTLGIPENESIKRRQRGRLKICSKSLVFDPTEIQHPILKFPFRDIQLIDKWIGPLLSRVDVKDKMIVVECKQVIQMKEGNIIAPYVFKKEDEKYLFSLTYGTVEDALPQMCQLHRASTLNRADQTAMINAIVMSRQARVKFDTSWLENLYEKIILESQGDRITPLVTNPGRIMLTNSRLYFQPFNNVEPYPVLKIKLSDIKRVHKRRFLLRHVGLELYCRNNPQCRHLYLALKSKLDRDRLHDGIVSQSDVRLEDSGAENMTLRWQNGLISNYEYLMYLNSMADRSINDLTQYPVFPWVIADYTSQTLDLHDPKSYRDLSKPIGALNEERLQRLMERYSDMPEPRFLYGSHYSTPGFVLFYLARVAPEYVLCLQTGRFDHPDRMFNNLFDAWKNCLSSFSDFKELIPEFYSSRSYFLQNNPSINYGVRHDGKAVAGVELPPWAADSDDFLHKLRTALESDIVSQNLHKWIDLIFGYKQRGVEAENAKNLFYYLTYEGAVDFEEIKDLNERAALENQIMEFGQTPKQLFTNPHPSRHPMSPRIMSPVTSPPLLPLTLQPDESVVDGPAETPENGPLSPDVSTESAAGKTDSWSQMKNLLPILNHKLHKESISDVKWGPDGRTVYSVSQDTLLKVYSLEDQRQLRSINLSNMPLSSCVVLPGGKSVIAGSWDNYIYVYSVEYGRMLENVYAHNDAVSGLCYNNENLLLSASWDSTVKYWKCTYSGKGLSEIELTAELDHESGVSCLCMKSDSTVFASGTKDGQIILWDVETQMPITQLHSHTGGINTVAFSPDNQRLISCGEDHYMRVIDIHTGTEVFAKDTAQELRCLNWDGHTVLLGGASGGLMVWDLNKVQLVNTLQAHKGAITCMDVSPSGHVVTGGEDRTVLTWKPM